MQSRKTRCSKVSWNCSNTFVENKHTRPVNTIDSKYIGKCYEFNCPHCDGGILVQWQDINCKIFRHAVYSHGAQKGNPINPHETQSNIEKLIDQNEIYGCGKPITMSGDCKQVHACDYV